MKRNLPLICFLLIPVFLLLIWAGMCFIVWMKEPAPKSVILPSQSEAGKITASSNGCCFVTYDVIVTAETQEGSIELMRLKSLYENQIFQQELPSNLKGPVTVNISFQYLHSQPADASFSIAVLENAEQLLQNGILIFIDENIPGLKVISGEETTRFQENKTQWIPLKTPAANEPLGFSIKILDRHKSE